MKKILALTLAAVMAAGMTTTAFADVPNNDLALTEKGSTDAPFIFYDKDDNDGIQWNAGDLVVDGEVIPGGTTVYLPIYDNLADLDNTHMVTSSDEVDDWKIDADWEINRPASKPEITSVKIDGKRIYAVAIELPEAAAKAEDLVGTIKMYTTKGDDEWDGKDKLETKQSRTVDISLTYGYKTEDFGDVNDFADAQIVDFDECDGEEDLDFGDYMTFTVNLDGQGKLNLKNNTKFVSEIADLDKSANMDFITFVDTPSFNKIGTAYIYAADDTFLYEVVDGKLEKVDADYNEDYEAWEFKTRTLGQYVISDKELDLETINTEVDDKDDASSTTEDGNKKNPDTGR